MNTLRRFPFLIALMIMFAGIAFAPGQRPALAECLTCYSWVAGTSPEGEIIIAAFHARMKEGGWSLVTDTVPCVTVMKMRPSKDNSRGNRLTAIITVSRRGYGDDWLTEAYVSSQNPITKEDTAYLRSIGKRLAENFLVRFSGQRR